MGKLSKKIETKTYKIFNWMGDLIKTVETPNIEDVIYDLKDYHGHTNVFTYKEVK